MHHTLYDCYDRIGSLNVHVSPAPQTAAVFGDRVFKEKMKLN